MSLPPGALGYDVFSSPAFESWRADRQLEAERAQATFDERARLRGITFDSRILSADVDNAGTLFGTIARNYDLSVVAQGEPDDLMESLAIESAIFDSGRPVLIVPYIQTKEMDLAHVMVCWDGSRNAARAIGDALPFLKRAGRIDLVTIEQKEQRGEMRGAQIANHLARHKLRVDLKAIVAPDVDVANVVLSQAADSGTGLIVMGAYGHTRLREFVLGGATRDILGSMTVPVLMSH